MLAGPASPRAKPSHMRGANGKVSTGRRSRPARVRGGDSAAPFGGQGPVLPGVGGQRAALRCILTSSSCAGIAPLCRDGLAQRLTWLRGPAACRGSRWATQTRARRLAGQGPSWAASARVREVARERVGDLSSCDPEELELLAQVCADGAAAEYSSAAPRAGSISFTAGRRRERARRAGSRSCKPSKL